MNLYVVKETVTWEGDNVYIVAAKNSDEAKQVAEAGSYCKLGSTNITLIMSDYPGEEGTVWSNI